MPVSVYGGLFSLAGPAPPPVTEAEARLLGSPALSLPAILTVASIFSLELARQVALIRCRSSKEF